jgi:integral membrane sensor domain MASE1
LLVVANQQAHQGRCAACEPSTVNEYRAKICAMGRDVVGIEFLRTRPYWLRLAIVAAVYYGAGVLGLRLSLVGRSVTPLWPPTGVAVVALLALGRRHWPAIALAAFAINAPISPNLAAALLISVGNTVAPVVAVTLLTRIGLSTDLERVRDASALVFLGALASMTISATVGSLALLRSGAIPASHFVGTWSVWWTGDAMGVLIVAPLLWSLRPVPPYATRRSVTETIAIAMLLLAACLVALNGTVQLLFLVVPVVGVIAWRYGQRGVARANFCVSLAATVVATHGFGPFAGLSLVGRMVKLQSFNATVAFTSILLAAAVAERERLASQQRAAVETLQRSLLPDRIYDAPGLEFAARYIPASRELALGGDWYDVISLSEGSYGFVVGDVAGHGALAAAVMGKLRMAIRAYARESLPPVQILRRVNTLLRDIHERSMATLWIGLYDPAEHEVVFANAGHVPPLLVDAREGGRFLDDVHGPPIGAVDGATYGESRRLLLPGSTLLLYTDGLVERRGRSIDDGMADLCARVGTDMADLEAHVRWSTRLGAQRGIGRRRRRPRDSRPFIGWVRASCATAGSARFDSRNAACAPHVAYREWCAGVRRVRDSRRDDGGLQQRRHARVWARRRDRRPHHDADRSRSSYRRAR